MTIDSKRGYFSLILLQFGEGFTTPVQKRFYGEFGKPARAIVPDAQ